MLVHIGETFVIGFAIFVFLRVRIGIAQAPDCLDEPFAFFVSRQFLPGIDFTGRKDWLYLSKPVSESPIRLGPDLSLFVLRIRIVALRLTDCHLKRHKDHKHQNENTSRHERATPFAEDRVLWMVGETDENKTRSSAKG